MKRFYPLFAFFCIFSIPLFAQQAWMDKTIISLPLRTELGVSATDESSLQFISGFIKKNIPVLSNKDVSIRLVFQNTSPLGNHYDYIQTWNNIDIYGSEVKINISSSGKVMSFYEKTADTKSWNVPVFPEANKVKLESSLEDSHRKITSVKEVIFITYEGMAVPAWKVEYAPDNSMNTGSMIIDQNYNILYRKSYPMNYHPVPVDVQDSMVKALVFLPDPLTTANRFYGAPFMDYNDSAVPAIDSQRKEVMMKVQYDKSPSGKDSFYLKSPYVQFVENDAPYTGTTWRSIPLFDFNRHQYGFEDVNVFYHLNVHQQHIQALGFTNLCNYQLKVDAHCSGLGDNSQFVPGSSKKDDVLSFGTGGVDDAEDPDVIIHEYTHGIRNSASAGTFSGRERMAAEEGFCDYFSCSYSKMLSKNQWERCFNWDGHNEFWPGRTCASSKVYPKDLNGEIHEDGEIVSASLMEIADEISRDTTDQLMLQAMYSLTSDMSMAQVMHEVVIADSLKYNGRHANIILCHFTAHGLDSQMCKTGIEDNNGPVKVKLLSSYFANNGILYLHFDKAQSGRISLYSMDGKVVFKSEFHDQVNLTYDEEQLASGMYVLHVSTQHAEQAIKVIKP